MLQNIGLSLKSGCFGISKCFLNEMKTFQQLLKENSSKIVQICVQNCECILAHRMHRSRQMLTLYSKLWGQESVNVMKNILNSNLAKSKMLMFIVLASSFDWSKERIPDEDILRFAAEMSLIKFLREKQEACLKGDMGPSDCKCAVCNSTDSEWRVFIKKPDIVVWRREDVNHRGKGLYCYKAYGSYQEIPAYDFLEAQLDLEYRKTWDSYAVKLEVIDSEPSSNSDVIYWETKWPSLFSNRDYVFKRRFKVDKQRNLLFIANQNTTHPAKPPDKKKERISEYWSYMVIKPNTTFDKPGMEFSLTYFENPGANVPSTMMNWATTSAMPEFLKTLRTAALGVGKRRGGSRSVFEMNKETVVSRDQRLRALVLESLRQTMCLF